jgi:sugar lactone lactonase YvrE
MSERILSTSILLMACGLLAMAGVVGAEDGIIDFDSDQWRKTNAEVVEHLGRKCLIGSAFLEGIELANGIIEYDIAVDGSRSFPGITFRVTSPQEYEELYLRPHASNRADALQYAAVFSGVAGWQLYNGKGYTAAIEIPRGEWLHIRLEMLGKQARVFVNHAEQPSLVINDLKHDVVKGGIGIKSARNRSACFSNFKVTVTDDLVFDAPPQPVMPRGIINEWELSQPFEAFSVALDAYPDPQLLKKITWQKVSGEPGGLVDVCRFVTRSPAMVPEVVFARTILSAEQAQTRELSFGYSDSVNLFLNGRMVFTGESSFRSRDANFVGVVGLNDTVYLPLEKGDNELMLMVLESFGGWGFMAQSRDDDAFHEGVSKLWQLSTELRMPESAIYDPQRDLLYVSNYFRGGNEFISKIGLDGSIVELEWITGLNRPTGMVVRGDRLWVVDRTGLHEIDIEAGEIAGSYPAPGAGFLNDVAMAEDGSAYVSDSAGSKLYRRAADQLEVWLEGGEVVNPNGMLVDGDRLLFGSSTDGCLRAANLADKQVTTIACFGDGALMDGLRSDGKGGFIVSDYNGRTIHIDARGRRTELVNTTSSGAKCADLEYIRDQGLIIIPGLTDNRLTAYRLTGI